MITLRRTDSEDPAFVALVKLLDADLAIRDGEDHAFYAQLNKIDKIRHVVIAYEGDTAMGCGAIREFSPDAMEVKRMFVRPEGRQKGIASIVLGELETWAAEMSYARTVLETGTKQPEAIELYTRRGYARIPNYGHYAGVENSLCFQKFLA
jgi:GNAT superfamily N-acetyltransferase